MDGIDLTRPVGAFLRPTAILRPEDSLADAAAKLRETGQVAIPVANSGAGMCVSEQSIARVLAFGESPAAPLSVAMEVWPFVHSFETGAAALREFEDKQTSELIVIDTDGRILGLLRPSDLFPGRKVEQRPSPVGGMATPFGVYLTNGAMGAGVPWYALVATGAVLGLLAYIALLVSDNVSGYYLEQGNRLMAEVAGASTKLLFLLGLRAIPLSGIHAAEHKVVHAMERGEPLTLSVVKRMPRIHPRCGTNLAAGLFVFFLVQRIPMLDSTISSLVALLAMALLYQPVGSLFQFLFTTKPPTDKQVMMGIRSGQALIDQYQRNPRSSSGILQRIWFSGLPFVLLGSMTTLTLADWIVSLFAH